MFKKKCPVCRSKNIAEITPSFGAYVRSMALCVFLLPIALFIGGPKKTYVCRDCKYNWK